MYNIIRMPDVFRIITESGTVSDASLNCKVTDGSLSVSLTAKNDLPKYVRLRWRLKTEGSVRLLGDAWERGYGDLEWRGIAPERAMPWYFLLSARDKTFCFGVMTRPSAMCHWQFDREGITLVLDVRNGGRGVWLDGRTLEAASVVYREYSGISRFEAARRFCSVMSPVPILPEKPVYGGNNWYYAYGNSSRREILDDSRFIAGISDGLENRPFMIIDDGWSPNACCGPWDSGNQRFPDMPALMSEMRELGVRPGLWIRPLTDARRDIPEECFLRGEKGRLDPTHPYTLNYISDTVKRLSDWGSELLKYDFTSYDTTGIWGKDAFRGFVPDGETWEFYDRGVTTAEALRVLYETIYGSAGKMLLLGCNCVNHLCAGYVHINRVGDDTSGRQWERTRFMGINSLAFRLPQDKSFFAADADCVGITADVPWGLNSKWLDLLSRSGTPLFVSCDRNCADSGVKAALREAFARASVGGDILEPLDWEYNTCPAVWKHNGNIIQYDFMEETGVGKLV